MRERHATNELDKIVGLASLAQPDRFPLYDPNQSFEDAWEVLVKVIGGMARAHLFLWYPEAGGHRYAWAPSWCQVMATDVPAADNCLEHGLKIDHDIDRNRNEFLAINFYILDECFVLGLGTSSPVLSSGSSVVRVGRIKRDGRNVGSSAEHEIVASHQVEISESVTYVLLFSERCNRFVVGKRDGGQIRKVCVLDFKTERSANYFRGIASRTDVDLI